MASELKNDINLLFSIFLDNMLTDLHQLLPPVPEAKRYQSELEDELGNLRAAVLHRSEQEFTS